ncbi:DUF4342 domain-containing protein [Thiocystis violacea]|uniref:DUF4342 domain-containing protein n=1 Tax=Thiocystis violacea TaxID=13725 RepID=UPI0019048D04|nr:DUF4342 domain-containing protein [Thiocystis violacea]MBK1716881.1 hypothetical protein [Thiocystis violacea]
MRNRDGRRPPDEIGLGGSTLLDRAKDLLDQGNLRRLIVRRPSGRVLVDIPLTAGVAVAAVLTLLTPMLVAIAAIAALVTQFRIEIERDQPPRGGRFDDD